MGDGMFNGKPHLFYFPDGHPQAGIFKGMVEILKERSLDPGKKNAKYKGFKCPPPQLDCCYRQMLYNQPDSANVPSCLELLGKEHDVEILFLPKFHCELNPIKQCWGYAKRIYCLNPELSCEDALHSNAISTINSVPLVSIRRFCNRSLQPLDAYQNGLDGKQAAWAARKYCTIILCRLSGRKT
ncbi:hypothetical protein FA15DRAFT_710379 [Coprinopsis marcescibilis]|uniref:Tc1-like transposase DDE domain-containing protein n=1 Tax=Coprinopsis marcescibilis TaxID=230819 RepID=A0A5C3KD49_COPMA|nr:hypothetical protein FA15DRAFT_710379 [Coprinopsis marcescibilis]